MLGSLERPGPSGPLQGTWHQVPASQASLHVTVTAVWGPALRGPEAEGMWLAVSVPFFACIRGRSCLVGVCAFQPSRAIWFPTPAWVGQASGSLAVFSEFIFSPSSWQPSLGKLHAPLGFPGSLALGGQFQATGPGPTQP